MFHKIGNVFLNKGELEILQVFARKPWQDFSTPDVKRITGKTSQHYVYATLGKMSSLGILKSRKAGKTLLYSLNLRSRASISSLSFLDEMSTLKRQIPQRNIEELIGSIKTPFFTFIISGSYAEGKQTQKSDLDAVIVVDKYHDKRRIEASLSRGELMIPEVHLYVFTDEEFLSMLLSEKENYGKEVARRNMIIQGAAPYYRILGRAIENGFKG